MFNRSCLLHRSLLLKHGNLTAHQEAGDAVVHVVDHRIPELSALEFEDQQRILLLVRCILNAMAQLIELTEVLLPVVIDDVEHDKLLKLLDDIG